MPSALDDRPVVIALAGPNGGGKTTFYHSFLERGGLRFVNADDLRSQLKLGAAESAGLADALRRELLRQRESFIFETVLSDAHGEKVGFLCDACASGYRVALYFIGLSSPAIAQGRVAMRVSQGGHDVPSKEVAARFPRALANLQRAIRALPQVFVFDNDKLDEPFRRVAQWQRGMARRMGVRKPDWLRWLQ